VSKVLLFIEGPNAEQAARSLFQLNTISGVWRPDGQLRESLEEGAIATIIGINEEPAVVLKQIREWRQACRESEDRKVSRVEASGPDEVRLDLEETADETLLALFDPPARE